VGAPSFWVDSNLQNTDQFPAIFSFLGGFFVKMAAKTISVSDFLFRIEFPMVDFIKTTHISIGCVTIVVYYQLAEI